MDVQERPGRMDAFGKGAHHQRADGDVGDEVTVHHIHVQQARPRAEHDVHLVAEAGEIGREDGRSHLGCEA